VATVHLESNDGYGDQALRRRNQLLAAVEVRKTDNYCMRIEVGNLSFAFLLMYEIDMQALTVGVRGVRSPQSPAWRSWPRPVLFAGDLNVKEAEMKFLNSAFSALEKAGVKISDAWVDAGRPKSEQFTYDFPANPNISFPNRTLPINIRLDRMCAGAACRCSVMFLVICTIGR